MCWGALRFKASFPYARKIDEEAEKQYVKSNFKNTSKEETAVSVYRKSPNGLWTDHYADAQGNIWVTPMDGEFVLMLNDDMTLE